jgi:hypothetical protein
MVKIIKTDSGYFYEISDEGKKTRVSEKAYKEYKKSRKMKGGYGNVTKVASTSGAINHSSNGKSTRATNGNNYRSELIRKKNVLKKNVLIGGAGRGNNNSNSIIEENVTENISIEELLSILRHRLLEMYEITIITVGPSRNSKDFIILREYYTMTMAVYNSILRFLSSVQNLSPDDYYNTFYTIEDFYGLNKVIMNDNSYYVDIIRNVDEAIDILLERYRPPPSPSHI